MNVLVSGVAGDIGFGVGRILRSWNWAGKLYGIDIQADHAGMFVFDDCTLAPKASESSYLDWLEDHIRVNDIKVFIPTSIAFTDLIKCYHD